jgi:probable DNA repair protein
MPPGILPPRAATRRCGWWTLSDAADSAGDARVRVTPTRRLAHFLRARHDEDCLARGLHAWPTPDIVTWDELVLRLFDRDRASGRLDGRWLPASAAQLVWARIIRDDAALSPLVSPAGLAREAWQSWRRLHDYRIHWEALEEAESPEVEAFARWCAAYRRLLEARGWIDPVVAQARVSPSAALPGIELEGFDALTPLQQALLDAWSAAGLEVRRRAHGQTASTPRRVTCLDEAAEIDAAARWAAAGLNGRRDRRLAIVVPDLARRRETVRRGLERILVPAAGLCGGPWPETQACELAAARPLVTQPVVAAALDLLDLYVRPLDPSACSRLLRNPWLGEAVEEEAARARLDAHLRRNAGPGLDLESLVRLARERGCPGLAGRLEAGQGVFSTWPSNAYPSQCSERILSFLSSLGWPGSAPDTVEHQVAQRCRELVSELGACDELTGRLGRGEAVGLVRELAAGVLFEPQELQAPLLVIDPETCAGMRFDGLWVMGLEASDWPPGASPDPFLPRLAQQHHGLPGATAEGAAAARRRVFERLLASAAEIVLSVPELEDEAPVLPSPWLDEFARTESPGEWCEPTVAVGQYADRPVLERGSDGSLPGIAPGESHRGGARVLELQSLCPFRAQAELRLGARPLEEPGLGVDPAERGDLAHRALAELWRGLGDQATLRALDATGRQAAVERAVGTALAAARSRADALLRHLLDLEADWLVGQVFAMVEADLVRPPFEVLQVEEPYRARLGPLTLELRPDRIDRLPDGSLALIDYKTGANAEPGAWLDERPKLPQLPAYVLAVGAERVGAVAFGRLRSGSAGYVGVARDAAQFPGLREPGGRGALAEYADWEALLGAWRRRLEVLAGEFAAGQALLAPDPARACRYCHLAALCRIAESEAAGARLEDGDD